MLKSKLQCANKTATETTAETPFRFEFQNKRRSGVIGFAWFRFDFDSKPGATPLFRFGL